MPIMVHNEFLAIRISLTCTAFNELGISLQIYQSLALENCLHQEGSLLSAVRERTLRVHGLDIE